jgi:hypothetical protein
VEGKALAVERPRCVHCRNPIKESHKAAGPTPGDRSYHEDCWNQVGATVVAEQPADQQRQYEENIASQGLAALLSPYVSKVPEQRGTEASSSESVPA